MLRVLGLGRWIGLLAGSRSLYMKVVVVWRCGLMYVDMSGDCQKVVETYSILI